MVSPSDEKFMKLFKSLWAEAEINSREFDSDPCEDVRYRSHSGKGGVFSKQNWVLAGFI